MRVATCFPAVIDAAPTDHQHNFMSTADQERFKYVLYAPSLPCILSPPDGVAATWKGTMGGPTG
jgi:hypothetical protein